MSNYYQVYRNLPETSPEETELTDQELDQVAGGFTPIPIPEGKLSLVKTSLTQIEMKPCITPALVQGSSQILR